jgi:hypothetical protein
VFGDRTERDSTMNAARAPASPSPRPSRLALVAGANWPVAQMSFDVLTDLGLSIGQIAAYFAVDPAEVRVLLAPAQD